MILYRIKRYAIYDVRVSRVTPTRLGRLMGFTEKTLIAVVSRIWGARWDFSGPANGVMKAGQRYRARTRTGYIIGLEFKLEEDGRLHQWRSVPEMAVIGEHTVITFDPKVEMVTDTGEARMADA